jgi:hypothetical protein
MKQKPQCPSCNTLLGGRGCLNHKCPLYVRGPFSPSEEALAVARDKAMARRSYLYKQIERQQEEKTHGTD